MITAYLFCKENGLPEETRAVIQQQADLLINAYSEYFRPYTGDDLKPVELLPILEAIEDNIAYLGWRFLCHNRQLHLKEGFACLA